MLAPQHEFVLAFCSHTQIFAKVVQELVWWTVQGPPDLGEIGQHCFDPVALALPLNGKPWHSVSEVWIVDTTRGRNVYTHLCDLERLSEALTLVLSKSTDRGYGYTMYLQSFVVLW